MTGKLRAGQVGIARLGVKILSWESLGNQRKNFFFEKKKQKTFDLLGDLTHLLPGPAGKRKFFASFFQKRSACFAENGNGDALARIAVGLMHGRVRT